MAPVDNKFYGPLQSKKKSDLKDIAVALGISDDGNREDLQARIRKYLDDNQAALEEQPAFEKLFTRRKRIGSAQPQNNTLSQEQRSAPMKTRRIKALDPVQVQEEKEDAFTTGSVAVSAMLQNPFSIQRTSETQVQITHTSPPPSPVRAALEVVRRGDVQGAVGFVKGTQDTMVKSAVEGVFNLRSFISNSRNIWSLTAIFELSCILYTVVPWQRTEVSLTPTSSITISQPIWAAFTTTAFWTVLLHWLVPTVFIPATAGTLVSFSHADDRSTLAFDPLTASIARLAAQIMYPFGTLTTVVQGIDVLGTRLRIFDAALGVVLAFAEVIVRGSSVARSKDVALSSVSGPSEQRHITAEETIVLSTNEID